MYFMKMLLVSASLYLHHPRKHTEKFAHPFSALSICFSSQPLKDQINIIRLTLHSFKAKQAGQ